MDPNALVELPYARLDTKTGRRVLCAHPRCPTDIATVDYVPAEVIIEQTWRGSPLLEKLFDSADYYLQFSTELAEMAVQWKGRLFRVVCFEPCWVEHTERTWRVSKHAREQLKRGQRLYRKPLGVRLQNRIMMLGTSQAATFLFFTPAKAVCPACGRLQLLDDEPLLLDTFEIQEFLMLLPDLNLASQPLKQGQRSANLTM